MRQEPDPIGDAHGRRRRRRDVRDDRARCRSRRHRLQVSPEPVSHEADLQQPAVGHLAEPVRQNFGEASRLQEIAHGFRDQVSIFIDMVPIIIDTILIFIDVIPIFINIITI